MGLLDSVMNVAGDLLSGNEGNSNLLEAATSLIKDHPDGLSGLIEQLRSGGLGDAVNSWVGTGENQAVSADALQQALGSSKLGEMAQQFGISNDQISSGLSAVLPQLINHLTPNGTVDANSNALMDAGLSLLKNKLFGA